MRRPENTQAFTLAELVVVVVMTGLLVLVLAPSLRAAGDHSDTDLCLYNLRSLGIAVRLYAEQNNGVLPGPLSPNVHHGISEQTDPAIRQLQLIWVLRDALGDTIGDRLATCPVMNAIVPDTHFESFYQLTGRQVFPFHYTLNNCGDPYGGPNYYFANTRPTDPRWYFGHEFAPGWVKPPVNYGAVANAADEWMIADAWYRWRFTGAPVNALPPNAWPELQQEGPYQWFWSGEALPNFAPHLRRGRSSYTYTSWDVRNDECWRILDARSDGVTNTLFFDGHAAGVPSRTLTVSDFQIMYGFRGTVNPVQSDPPAYSPVWDGVWR